MYLSNDNGEPFVSLSVIVAIIFPMNLYHFHNKEDQPIPNKKVERKEVCHMENLSVVSHRTFDHWSYDRRLYAGDMIFSLLS
jgi:hypothetical protein